jgi:hypothetical protein
MKTYENTFQTLGDLAPMEAESARQYAKGYLPMFVLEEDKQPDNWYRIENARVGYTRTGWIKEIQWWDRLYEATEEKAPYEWDPGCWSGLISEERLLDFLEEAVEEVKEDGVIELTTDHSQSHYGIPVLLIDGEPYGPADSIEHTAFANAGGVAVTAGYWVAAQANGSDDPEFIAQATLFCSQWPEGPQPER